MLPFSIPIFPLPTVVLFPNVFLPLHIFEPRYRQLVAESLAGDRMIGMVLLRPGYESDYDARPPIYSTGCSGLITHAEKLDDGRYNLVLRGIEKFTIHSEEDPAVGRLYRSAMIKPIEEFVSAHERPEIKRQRSRLEELLAPLMAGAVEQHLPPKMADEDLINTLAQYLEFEPIEKLALLEQQGVLARGRTMVDLLEMKAMGSSGDAGSVLH